MAGPEEGSGKQEAEEALKRAEALSLSGDEQDEEARRGDAATLLRRIRELLDIPEDSEGSFVQSAKLFYEQRRRCLDLLNLAERKVTGIPPPPAGAVQYGEAKSMLQSELKEEERINQLSTSVSDTEALEMDAEQRAQKAEKDVAFLRQSLVEIASATKALVQRCESACERMQKAHLAKDSNADGMGVTGANEA